VLSCEREQGEAIDVLTDHPKLRVLHYLLPQPPPLELLTCPWWPPEIQNGLQLLRRLRLIVSEWCVLTLVSALVRNRTPDKNSAQPDEKKQIASARDCSGRAHV